ncbi:hypothetical protein BX285_7276 [Streptomyces sp. 1114.5]|uniref:hypothetical protein n=1 Tax=Streptomyces sp. 1114.5 TaxID=1938830 RepID=UPI000EAE97A1|nr:hypothetical protein [Streptomyces sp. 1114.5]RKT08905.1 hypothetical protein BX285_7276 [Streptomyces sp. 1114.5]
MPEVAGWRPVAVLPLWRRGEHEERENADRPGVLRGHSGPAEVDQWQEVAGPALPPELPMA